MRVKTVYRLYMKGKAVRNPRFLTAEYENERISNQLRKFIPEISADQL